MQPPPPPPPQQSPSWPRSWSNVGVGGARCGNRLFCTHWSLKTSGAALLSAKGHPTATAQLPPPPPAPIWPGSRKLKSTTTWQSWETSSRKGEKWDPKAPSSLSTSLSELSLPHELPFGLKRKFFSRPSGCRLGQSPGQSWEGGRRDSRNPAAVISSVILPRASEEEDTSEWTI